MFQNGFVKVGLNVPVVRLGKPLENALTMIEICKAHENCSFMLFPEMALTGYSLGDWFYNCELLEESNLALKKMVEESNDQVWMFGGPLSYMGSIYNVCYVVQNKHILGIVPKIHLPKNREFYDNRMFASGKRFLDKPATISLFGEDVLIGSFLFQNKASGICFGVEICADIWVPNSPSTNLYLNGAQMIFNLSASTYYVGKRESRTKVCENASLKGEGAYLFVSNGITETSSDYTCLGHRIYCELGEVICDKEEVSFINQTSIVDVDIMAINFCRYSNGWFHETPMMTFSHIEYILKENREYKLDRTFNHLPFVVKDSDKENIIEVLSGALYKRLMHIGIKKVVIGISGGLDSAFALLNAYECFKKYDLGIQNIIAVTMPSLVTGEKSKNLALDLMKKLGVDKRLYPIQNGVLEQFSLIGQDPLKKDVTYENTQARYRTLTLMNLANKENALVLGTGDMSEIALGWSTFAGDQISMYNLNAGLPKTAIKSLVAYYGIKYPNLLTETNAITNAIISPELTGSDQDTESVVGPYDQNDFIMYHIFMRGASKERIVFLLQKEFKVSLDVAIKRYDFFMNRFKHNQFKRYASPESVKIFELSLSPRGDFRFPGDMN